MRIALAQINPTVGDLAGNVRRHHEFVSRAREAGAEVVMFPELSVVGYPPKDLLNKAQFVDDALRAVSLIAARCVGIEAVVGFVDRNPAPVGRALVNVMGILRDGKIAST